MQAVQYMGHGANTGGLQAHSIGDEYPLITHMRGEFWRILDSRTGNVHELEYEHASDAHADAREFKRRFVGQRIGRRGSFTSNSKEW